MMNGNMSSNINGSFLLNGNAANTLANTLAANTLESLDKPQLIEMVLNLNNTVSKLQEDYKHIINLRLYTLERNMNMSHQYYRRDTLEINGIPSNVDEKAIEENEEVRCRRLRQCSLSDQKECQRRGKRGRRSR